ncbi:hypothetical protein BASA62_004448 [Batrachochytrium salamandrivorans]|nr:hypothetical protein BASA62_004448 [Batrachochytrium salamandrivorans]
MKEHVKFSVDEVRSIMKELVTALVFLKNLGVLHGSIIEQNMLYNRKTGHMKLINFAFSEPREGWNQDNSVQAKSSDSASRFFDYRPEVLDREMKDIENISYFLLLILTLERPYKDTFNHLEGFTKGFRDRLEDPESQSAVDAADLMATLFGYGSYQITSMEVILTHSFFTRQ